jgi:HK97 family phage major capsid protein
MSMKLNELMNERGATYDRALALRAAAEKREGQRMTPAETAEWYKIEVRMEELNNEIDDLRRGVLTSSAGVPSVASTPGDIRSVDDLHLGERRMADYVQDKGLVPEEQQGLSMRKWLRGAVTGDWHGADLERRALAEGAISTGGALVPTPLSAEIIDLARNQTQVLKAGARIVPMTSSTLTYPRLVSDPSVAWHSEAASISPSNPTFEQVTLTARTLAGEILMSRELVEDAQGGDTEINRVFATQFALALDKAALYGSGTPPEPRGVKNTTNVTIQSMGTNGAQISGYTFLINALGTLADNNFDPANPNVAVLGSTRTWRQLALQADTTGQPLRKPDVLVNTPILPTNQIGNAFTQGTSNVASDAFVGKWDELIIGMRTQVGIQVLHERYADTGQIGLLGWMRADVLVARPKAFVVIEGIIP